MVSRKKLGLIVATIAVFSGCGDGDKSKSVGNAKASLSGLRSSSEGKAVELDASQIDALLTIMKLPSSRHFQVAGSYGDVTQLKADASRPCSKGGRLISDAIDSRVTGKRLSDTELSSSSTLAFSMKAAECKLFDSDTTRLLKGEVKTTSETEGTSTDAVGKTPVGEENPDAIDFNLAIVHSLSGSLEIEGFDGEALKSHKIDFTDFVIGYEISDEKKVEFAEISADPLGEEQEREGKIEFLKNTLKCSGSVTLDGNVLSCEDAVATFVHTQIYFEQY